MGVDVIATRGDEYLDGERVGSAGSADVFMGVLFGGYAVGKHPESKRVVRWVGNIVPSPAGFPYQFTYTLKPADLEKALAFENDDGIWVTAAERTVERGLKLKPVTCPLLRALVDLWRKSRFEATHTTVPAGRVPAAAAAVRAAHVELVRVNCPWANKVGRILAVFDRAAAEGGAVRFSF